jgi:hypothetical protein
VIPLVAVELDPIGNISLVLQIVILFLLILGLPFAKGMKTKKNLVIHGYLTIVALVLHTILIFIVMVPSFMGGFGEIGELSTILAFTVWSHVVLGTLAEVLGVIVVGVWLSKSVSKMNCGKMKRWMLPIFIIWAVSIVNGALVHILALL